MCNFATPNFGAGMLKRDRARESGRDKRSERDEDSIIICFLVSTITSDDGTKFS